MEQKRTVNTIYMLVSVDGKISTGNSDSLDFDKDLPKIIGVKEGLQQYYDIEKTTDIFSLNTGRVMAKIGINNKTDIPVKIPVTFIIVDNKPHLAESGVKYLSEWTKELIIVTTNKSHPAVKSNINNVKVLHYPEQIDFNNLFKWLKEELGAERVTLQSGGEMNASLIRAGLVDYISVVVAPVIVGGRNTSTLVDGESLKSEAELKMAKALELIEAKKLSNSYLHLIYKVIN